MPHGQSQTEPQAGDIFERDGRKYTYRSKLRNLTSGRFLPMELLSEGQEKKLPNSFELQLIEVPLDRRKSGHNHTPGKRSKENDGRADDESDDNDHSDPKPAPKRPRTKKAREPSPASSISLGSTWYIPKRGRKKKQKRDDKGKSKAADDSGYASDPVPCVVLDDVEARVPSGSGALGHQKHSDNANMVHWREHMRSASPPANPRTTRSNPNRTCPDQEQAKPPDAAYVMRLGLETAYKELASKYGLDPSVVKRVYGTASGFAETEAVLDDMKRGIEKIVASREK